MELRIAYLRSVFGMNIGRSCRIAMTARLDKTNPRGVWIGDRTGIAIGAVVLAHDFNNARHVTTKIGSDCHIGTYAVIMPGIEIGNNVVVSPGSVVMKNVPSGCIVGGNPARVVEKGIVTGAWGVILRDNPVEEAM